MAVDPSLPQSPVDDDGLSVDVTQHLQTFAERLQVSQVLPARQQDPDPRNVSRLLRLGGERRAEAEGQRENQYGSWLHGEPSSSFRSAASSSARTSRSRPRSAFSRTPGVDPPAPGPTARRAHRLSAPQGRLADRAGRSYLPSRTYAPEAVLLALSGLFHGDSQTHGRPEGACRPTPARFPEAASDELA